MRTSSRLDVAVAILALLLLGFPAVGTCGWQAGTAWPGIDQQDVEGALPGQLEGKVVLIDFWASWCGPCRHSFPVLEDLHKRFGPEGLVVLAVCVDESDGAMQKFLKKCPVTFCVVRDRGHKVVVDADVATMPYSFLIDHRGVVRFMHEGFHRSRTASAYETEITQLLQELLP